MLSVHVILVAFMLLHLLTVSATNTTSSFELEKELRQVRVELCASHIDRNKTTSALDQFQKISGEEPVKDLVKYYIEVYEDNLDDLLQFLLLLKSDVQQIGYQTIFELCEANNNSKCGVFSVLKIYKFVKENYSDNDVKNVNDQIETTAINVLVRSDLLKLINYTNDRETGPSFSEFFPLVIQRIYNTNPNRTEELLNFVDQVTKNTIKIKFLHALLKEVVPKRNIEHLSLILYRFKPIKFVINDNFVPPHEECCLIKSMEKDFPDYFEPYLSNNNVWLIKNIYVNEYLHWYTATQFNFDPLYTDNLKPDDPDKSAWYVTGTFFDVYSTIASLNHGGLQIDRCIHNDTFVRLNIPGSQLQNAVAALRSLWTVETDYEISFIRFKNSATGEYLSVNVNYKNIDQDSNSSGDMHKVVLSKIANEQTKWRLEVNPMFPYSMQPENNCEIECD